jgi:hypothetical protein
VADSIVHPQPASREDITVAAVAAHSNGTDITAIVTEVIDQARMNLYTATEIRSSGSHAAGLFSDFDNDDRLDTRTILIDIAVAHLTGADDPLTIAIDAYLAEENSPGYGTVPGVPAITRRQVEDMLSR